MSAQRKMPCVMSVADAKLLAAYAALYLDYRAKKIMRDPVPFPSEDERKRLSQEIDRVVSIVNRIAKMEE